MRVSADEVARLLGTLDAAARARFVADLWECRGYEVTVGEGVVVARNPVTGASERVGLARRTLTGWRLDCDAPDAVVAPRDGAAPRRLATDRSATFVGPETLRNMLLYAVDAADRRRLFETHFDRSPHDPQRSGRRRPVRFVTDRAELFVTLVVLVAVVAGVSAHRGVVGERTSAPASDASASAAATATPTPSTARRGEFVLVYRTLGDVEVTPPPWYAEARNATGVAPDS
jgi:hypothetical protein